MRNILKAAGLAFATLAGGVAQAHHSFAVHFVADKIVTVQGVVTDYRLRNPHGTLAFDVTAADGSVAHWKAETNSPNVLRRRGWTPASLKPGDQVTVEGFPARDGSNYMRISRVIFADGRILMGQSPGTGIAPPEGDEDYDD